MKRFKRFAYIILIAVVIVLSLTVYTNATKNDNKTQEEKTYSEVQYLETKLENLLNSMNNIETRNYKVSVDETNEAAGKKSQEETSSEMEKNNSSSEDKTKSSQNNSGSGESTNNEDKEKSSKKFELKTEGVLTTTTNDINWDNIKEEIEILYMSLPTITVDLYKTDLNKEDVLNFNKEFDNLTINVKNQKKEETLAELSKLYEYMPKFVQTTTSEDTDKVLSETKTNIFKAYSKLDLDDWNGILKDIKAANDSYSKLLTNTNIDESKQYSISKGYIMINELQNTINLKDKSVFLIKYKNLIEEFNSI